MANHNQLNKAQPNDDFEIVFQKQEKLCEAIKELVRTAYLNHHLETNQRNIRLTECLEKQCKILLESLADDDIKENVRTTIEKYIESDVKIKTSVKEKVKTDIQSVISEKFGKDKTVTQKIRMDNLVLNTKQLNGILQNEKIVESIIKRSREKFQNVIKDLKKNNILGANGGISKGADKVKNVIPNVLKGNKNTSIRLKEQTEDKLKRNGDVKSPTVRQSAKEFRSGLDTLLRTYIQKKIKQQSKKKSITEVVTNRLYRVSESIKKSMKSMKDRLRKLKETMSMKSIGKGLMKSLKSLPSLILGGIKGLLGGLFKLTKGIISFGVGVIKSAYKIVKGVIKGIFKITGGIVKGITKLTVGFVERIKIFFKTPTGMFVTGFIIGYVTQKIKQIYRDKIQPFFDKTKEKTLDILQRVRIGLLHVLTDEKLIKVLDVLERFKPKIAPTESKLEELFHTIGTFFGQTKKMAFGFAGGTIGAIIGRIIGYCVAGFCGPIAPFIPGVGTALGSVAGYMIGKALGDMPDEDNISQDVSNSIINRTIRDRFKSRKNKFIRQHRGKAITKLKVKDNQLSAIDREIQRQGITEEQKIELQKKRDKIMGERNKLQEIVDATNNGFIEFEDATTRNERQRIIDGVVELLEQQEQIIKDNGDQSLVVGMSNSKFKIEYPFEETIRLAKEGKISSLPFSHNKVSGTEAEVIHHFEKIFIAVMRSAIMAYEEGNIRFEDIPQFASMVQYSQTFNEHHFNGGIFDSGDLQSYKDRYEKDKKVWGDHAIREIVGHAEVQIKRQEINKQAFIREQAKIATKSFLNQLEPLLSEQLNDDQIGGIEEIFFTIISKQFPIDAPITRYSMWNSGIDQKVFDQAVNLIKEIVFDDNVHWKDEKISLQTLRSKMIHSLTGKSLQKSLHIDFGKEREEEFISELQGYIDQEKVDEISDKDSPLQKARSDNEKANQRYLKLTNRMIRRAKIEGGPIAMAIFKDSERPICLEPGVQYIRDDNGVYNFGYKDGNINIHQRTGTSTSDLAHWRVGVLAY